MLARETLASPSSGTSRTLVMPTAEYGDREVVGSGSPSPAQQQFDLGALKKNDRSTCRPGIEVHLRTDWVNKSDRKQIIECPTPTPSLFS
jgi:hypothetical protein